MTWLEFSGKINMVELTQFTMVVNCERRVFIVSLHHSFKMESL